MIGREAEYYLPLIDNLKGAVDKICGSYGSYGSIK